MKPVEQQVQAATVFHYRLDDDPTLWLVMIAPGADFHAVERSIRNRFGANRVLEVRRHGDRS